MTTLALILLAQTPALAGGWTAWQNGDIAAAEAVALEHAGTDPGRHLLILCASVQGKYDRAIALQREMDPSYPRLKELDEPVFHALLHLRLYDEAVRFARQRGMEPESLAAAEELARRPLTVTLDSITYIPFAEHPLQDYLPPFEAHINGQAQTVHLDTGGTWLHMGPDRARRLGIELAEAGTGRHGNREVNLLRGMAQTFRLGDALLENVPVIALPTLTQAQDFIIFGTNVLEQFLTTIDYPGAKMALSPKGDGEMRKRHAEIHQGETFEVPFYLWGDHYMFARGGFGERRDLTFFIDSGLVALDPTQGMRQACFVATPSQYEAWGVEPALAGRRFFETDLPISLGPLRQTRQYFTTMEPAPASQFGGVRIDGLISHAFLNAYVWTLDFERHRYLFSSPSR